MFSENYNAIRKMSSRIRSCDEIDPKQSKKTVLRSSKDIDHKSRDSTLVRAPTLKANKSQYIANNAGEMKPQLIARIHSKTSTVSPSAKADQYAYPIAISTVRTRS